MQKNELENIRELLQRIHHLMARYFDAMESSVHNNNYSFQAREQDARVFNTLAQTLMRLTELDNLVKPLEGDKDDEAIQESLEQRLIKVAQSKPDKNLPQ